MENNYSDEQRAAIELARIALDNLVKHDVWMFYDSEVNGIAIIDARNIDYMDFDLFKDDKHNQTVGKFFDGCEYISNECGNMPADDCFLLVEYKK